MTGDQFSSVYTFFRSNAKLIEHFANGVKEYYTTNLFRCRRAHLTHFFETAVFEIVYRFNECHTNIYNVMCFSTKQVGRTLRSLYPRRLNSIHVFPVLIAYLAN